MRKIRWRWGGVNVLHERHKISNSPFDPYATRFPTLLSL